MSRREIRVCHTAAAPEMRTALYTSRSRLVRDMRERGVLVGELSESEAQTFTEDVGFGPVAFVLFEPGKSATESERLALLAHEAVHAAYRYMEGIDEENPGEEHMAYAVQAACTGLFEAYLKEGERRG